METSTSASSPCSSPAAAMADESPRVKFLCSFGGSILPRPLDGKLRYVGGETRIVSVPRDVSFEDLMGRMRDLFDGAWALKYQQPDEDLDALVSVVNDDDVTNMMEEYDKIGGGGGGDGFTRLRIFLFSHPDLDAGAHFDSSDERETERRYVDALNSLMDGKPQPPDVDAARVSVAATEQFFSGQINLHNLSVSPHQHSHGQRYSDIDGPRSPVYYSPRHHAPHDPREFPPSPSSVRFHPGFGDLGDRVPEEYVRHSPALHPQFTENVVWLPPGGIVAEKAGFPGNLGHTHSVYEGSSVCEHCRMAFQRNQAVVPEARFHDTHWKPVQSHIEQLNIGNEFAAQYQSNSCAECFRSRAVNLLNQDIRLDQGVYVKEQSERHPFYDELHSHERGRVLHHHQSNHHPEELRGHHGEQFIIDGNGLSFPFAHSEGHSVPYNCITRDDPPYIHPASELGNAEVYHDKQTVGAGFHMHIPQLGDGGIPYGNNPSTYGADNLYQMAPSSSSIHTLRRKVQGPVHPGLSHETPGLVLQANGAANMGMIRTMQDGSPRISRIMVDDQNRNPWVGHGGHASQKVFPIDVPVPPEYYYEHTLKSNMNITSQENQPSFVPESIQCQPSTRDYGNPDEALTVAPPSSCQADDEIIASLPTLHCPSPRIGTDLTMGIGAVDQGNLSGEAYKTKQAEMVKEHNVCKTHSLKEKQDTDFDSNGQGPTGKEDNTSKLFSPDASGPYQQQEVSAECLNFLPELIASVKKAVLEGAEEVKARAQANADVDASPDLGSKESSMQNTELVNAQEELDADSDAEPQAPSKIEPTAAEAEALAKGLQTIKNDDLEEIRELGSGTYGSVYHGKWKGSDVAIKRIKASCFAGRPSERERLIADFWKEALILSSLHHPNVVSFYGIVRDGPDGSLATVTEFMVNGSLKQFLQKKDRTIDRRKRLIIAMDAAFGMEYLHGKNIVHFDLKCENLLVNMRDPHRPICKIGDLGLSKVKQKTLVSGGVRGTLPWMAPELLSGKSNMVTEKIDVYSFGIVMWELLTGEEPYANMHCASIIGGIVNNTLRPQIPTWCDPEWKSLMESCWSSDSGERPSFSEISQKLRKMAAAINVK